MRVVVGVIAIVGLVSSGIACTEPPVAEGEGEAGEGEGEGDDGALDGAASFLEVAPATALPADGIAAFSITAHLKDRAGRPLPSLAIELSTDVGTFGATSTAALTSGVDGTAQASLSSTVVGQATVRATVTTPQGAVALAPLVVEFEGCRTPEQAYAEQVYPLVFSRCQGCHNELGFGRLFGMWQIPFPGVPDWASRSVAVLDDVDYLLAPVPTDDGAELPLLVAKPSGRLEASGGHVGGTVIAPGSEEERVLVAFVDSLVTPNACTGAEDAVDAALTRVVLASPRDSYARAKRLLTGEVATPEELSLMPDTEEELAARVDALLQTPAFLAHVRDWYGDWLLTDRFTKQMGGRTVLNRNGQFERRFFYAATTTGNTGCDPATDDCCAEQFSDAYCAGKEDALIDTLAREPLEIIARTVANDRPMSEVVTLDHTLMTPLSATFYGYTDADLAATFDANPDNDATETKAAKVKKTVLNNVGFVADGQTAVWPHAGVLTTHALLGRFPTTTSNKNRGRANSITMRRFMNIDVMKFAEFSVASLAPDADLESATQTENACVVCHAAVDPLAGLWRSMERNGQFRKAARVVPDIFDPGFGTEVLPQDDPREGITFFAPLLAAHERFPLAMAMAPLGGLLGFEEVDPSIAADDPAKDEKMLASAIQRRFLEELVARFRDEHGLVLRPLVKDIVLSPFFRAARTDGAGLTDVEKGALLRAGVGKGVVSTPEQLDDKIASAFGFFYRANRSPTATRLLDDVNQYRILFGGLNYNAVTKRFRDPSPVQVRVIERLANEVSCVATAQDFAIVDPAARRLFRTVDVTTTDAALVRTELVRLFRLLLDEQVAAGDEELEAAVQLWVDVQAQGKAAVDAGTSTARIAGDCDATQSFEATPVTYPTADRRVVRDDPDYVVRAWMATLSYLLSDPRFFID